MRRIVVGIDGSRASEHALRWAIEEARAHGASLEVVMATAHAGWFDAATAGRSRAEIEEATRSLLDKVIDEVVLEHVDASGVEVHRTVRFGDAADELRQVAEGADLLVVGARGQGGFRGLTVGSVAHQVVSHAPCPVVVTGGPVDDE